MSLIHVSGAIASVQTFLPLHVPRQWPQPVPRGQGWLYVHMCSLHGRPCVWLPFAAAWCLLHSLLPTDDACSSSCLSTTVSKFSIFSTPLANFLLSRPYSVEYGNSKTTTSLPSAKCTRPLLQGRTACGGRPSGWHDIVTCQRLVIIEEVDNFQLSENYKWELKTVA